ncbi:hypothetical protein FE773_01775 [Caminibacter mediatlanticus TB-2]|uniref:Glycosyltransferase family 4 protein n=2 Tax=Caminibacter mediatlanticus TaxID=291048 RepID=A0ABX5VAW4_9BACT|nr:hypothetical protein FE773_01775 [Caminibacter mediatlanticus TB-2]
MKKVLLIEFNFFHDEVVIPLIDVLSNIENIELHCILNEDIKKRNTFILTDNKYKIKKILYFKKELAIYKQFLNFKYIYDTYKYILKNNIDIIIFNTLDVYNLDVKFLLNLVPNNIKVLGVLHNTNIVSKKFLKKIDTVILLNECIKYNYKKEVFYPILYKYKNIINIYNKNIITIPGNIEYGRRNYKFLLNFVKKNKYFCHEYQIKFNLLSNINKDDGPEVFEFIKQNSLQDFFILHDGFVEYDKFIKNLQNSFLIMPLLNNESYLRYKTSAAFNMAFSLNIPLFLEDKFIYKCNLFDNFSYCYKENNYNDLLNTLKEAIYNRSKYIDKINNIFSYQKFSLNYQLENFKRLFFNDN